MAIKNDYILDMVARFVDGIARSMEKARGGLREEAAASYERIAGDVLDMDPAAALALSPASLVMMVQLTAVDESLAVYMVYALERAAELYDAAGDATGGLRREQAQAVADAYGFEVTSVPPEVEAALAEGCTE